MSNFRTKLLGLAAVATAFAGISYGQPGVITCAVSGPTPNPSLRAEGETELLAQLVATCTPNAAANWTAATTSGQLILTTTAPITSKAVTVGNLPSNEATVQVNAGAGIQGVVNGSQVSFNLASLPTTAAFTLTVSNIRVNASAATNPQITESGILSYANQSATPPTSANTSLTGALPYNAGFVLQTLGATSLPPFTTNNYTVCVGNVVGPVALSATNTSFQVQIKELVGGAFKTLTDEGGQVVGANGIGTANTATQIQLTLGNIPSSATVYALQAITQNGTTIAIANSTPISTGPLNGYVGFTPTSGTVTIVYTVTADAAVGAQTFVSPIIVSFAANSAPAQTSPMNVLATYAPTGAVTGPATSVPTFAASTATAVNASTLTACSTTLLFPYVTNVSGFETGIAVVNATTDNLGVIPGKPSAASPVNGTCTINFYGNAAQPTAVTTPTIGAYTSAAPTVVPVYANILTSMIGSSGFSGYAIAQCNFLEGHGFAFITDTTGTFSGTEGYLATVVPASRNENNQTGLTVSIAPGGGAANFGVATTASGTITGLIANVGQ